MCGSNCILLLAIYLIICSGFSRYGLSPFCCVCPFFSVLFLAFSQGQPCSNKNLAVLSQYCSHHGRCMILSQRFKKFYWQKNYCKQKIIVTLPFLVHLSKKEKTIKTGAIYVTPVFIDISLTPYEPLPNTLIPWQVLFLLYYKTVLISPSTDPIDVPPYGRLILPYGAVFFYWHPYLFPPIL